MHPANAKRRRLSSSRRYHARQQRHRSWRLNLETLETRRLLTGTWTPVTNLDPAAYVTNLVLLSDGSIMSPRNVDAGSQKLTPDVTGSYANGTWSPLAYMDTGRPNSSQFVLPDGRLLILGGTGNSTYTNTGVIYDSVANSWTSIAPFPESTFGNGPSMLLADGRVIAGSIVGPQTYIYNPATNSWSNGPTKLFGDSSRHESWTLLADGSVLSYDVNGNPGEAQRLDPTTMTWIDSGVVPVSLEADITAGNMGPGVLLPDGQVLQLGRSSQTAVYTPSITPGGTGTWSVGPVIPNGLESGGASDVDGASAAAMLPTGHVMFVAQIPGSGGPTKFFEFDPSAPSSLMDVSPPIAALQSNSLGGVCKLLLLPSGQVLLGTGNNSGLSGKQLYLYTPDGGPNAAWKPTITSVAPNSNHYTLTGTQLNGLSAGSAYSAGTAMATNYPIIELKDGSGHAYFARTFNWSSAGVQTGSTPVSTDFTLPPGMPYGTYSLSVVANGIASDPVSFTGGVVGTSADLAVVNSDPSAATEGDSLTYSITVRNAGPSNATNVMLTDTLGANLSYLSATKSQGSVSQKNGVVTFTVGSLAVGQSATLTVTAQATEDGNLTNTAAVAGGVFDIDTTNNTAIASTAVAEAPIVVSAPITVSGKKVNNQTVATFTHANGIEPASAFVAMIDWGDGNTSTGTISLSRGTYYVQGSHTYSSNGSHTVTTTVVEASSGSGSMTAMALVSGNTVDDSSAATGGAIGSGGTVQSPTTDSNENPPRIKSSLIDQLLAADFESRGSRTLARRLAAASNDVLDNLFAAE
jgi:uncharacterized repeat protein (TIGR01451 family)